MLIISLVSIQLKPWVIIIRYLKMSSICYNMKMVSVVLLSCVSICFAVLRRSVQTNQTLNVEMRWCLKQARSCQLQFSFQSSKTFLKLLWNIVAATERLNRFLSLLTSALSANRPCCMSSWPNWPKGRESQCLRQTWMREPPPSSVREKEPTQRMKRPRCW